MVEGTSPTFNVTDVQNFTAAQDPQIARRVKGTVTVPCYLSPSCAPGGTFALERRTACRPETAPGTANFDCIIPRSAVDGTRGAGAPVALRARPVRRRLARSASSTQRDLADTYDFVLCATDEIGMSQSDLGSARGDRQRPHQLPEARRPPPAGPARRALPRPGDDPSRRLHAAAPRSTSTAPCATPSVIDTQPPLLRRQQPGRDHGRRADRALARLHPRGARRRRR